MFHFFGKFERKLIQNEVRLGEGSTIKVDLLIPFAMFCAENENAAVPYGFLPMLQCLCNLSIFSKIFSVFSENHCQVQVEKLLMESVE